MVLLEHCLSKKIATQLLLPLKWVQLPDTQSKEVVFSHMIKNKLSILMLNLPLFLSAWMMLTLKDLSVLRLDLSTMYILESNKLFH
jgi:hypothetical protein